MTSNEQQKFRPPTTREKEVQKYGKWASDKIDKPVNPIRRYRPVETMEDVGHLRNTMARGNYPLGMTDCEVVGINGNCGEECPVLLSGMCEHVAEYMEAHPGSEQWLIEDVGYDIPEGDTQ